MAEVMHNPAGERQEFWRPAVDDRDVGRTMELPTDTCDNCGTDYTVGARFCHVCGDERAPKLSRSSVSRFDFSRWLDFEVLKTGLGLTTGAIIAFFVGMVCTIAAAVTGFLYNATTLLDWQAVQIWRVEWLLAAVVAFVGGILLKRN